MIERLSAMSPRAKLILAVGLIILTPLVAWVAYNVGAWMGSH